MGFGIGLDAKWKARQSGKPDSAINRDAIHGGGDLVDFGGETLVRVKPTVRTTVFHQRRGLTLGKLLFALLSKPFPLHARNLGRLSCKHSRQFGHGMSQ